MFVIIIQGVVDLLPLFLSLTSYTNITCHYYNKVILLAIAVTVVTYDVVRIQHQ